MEISECMGRVGELQQISNIKDYLIAQILNISLNLVEYNKKKKCNFLAAKRSALAMSSKWNLQSTNDNSL